MATLDQTDLNNIRAIVQSELQNNANANTYITRLDATISSRATPGQGLTTNEHNHLMALQNTSIATNTKLTRAALALTATKNKRKR